MNTSVSNPPNLDNKIIYVQWDSYYGGIERITQSFEQIFASYNPLVVILRPTKQGIDYENCYVFTQNNRLLFILNYFIFVRKRRKSIFHIQYTNSQILLVTFLAGARKIIYHFHGTKFTNNFFDIMIWRWLNKKVIPIANSMHTQSIILNKLQLKSDIKIIPNLIGIKNIDYVERIYNPNETFVITYAGRFDKGKNINLIVETAKVFYSKKNKAQFNLVGDGPEKENIQKLIKAYNLESKIKIIPYTNEILKIYYDSNLFLFTSLHESFGNVVAEAVLTGLPVLANNLPAVRELIKDDLFFFERADAQIIADKINYIMNEYQTVTSRLRKVNDRLRDYLDNDKIISSIDFLYRSLG